MYTLQMAIEKTEQNKETSIRDIEKTSEQRKRKLENTFLFYQEAMSTGMAFDSNSFDSYWIIESPTISIEKKEEWKIIHNIVGPLKHDRKTAIGDGRSRKVKITLVPINPQFQHIEFSYVTKLPKNARCKIVTRKYSSSSVVCNI